MYSELYGVPARILRIGNAYGPLQRPGRSQGVIASFLDAARADLSVDIFGDGLGVRDYVHVKDVVSVIRQLAGRQDGPIVVNVGSGIGHSILDVLAVVRRITGRQLSVRWGPGRPFDVRAIVLSVAQLASLVDWHPMSLEAGVRATWETLAE
jgi:UDP-glucose 4-epimerase